MLLVRTPTVLSFCTVLLCLGCSTLNTDNVSTENIKIIGHGGAGFQSPRNELPHNSMESIKQAVEFYGIEGVEVDVQLSKSGNLWMYHDETLETQTRCSGCIIQKTDTELADCAFKNDVQVNVLRGNISLASLGRLLQRTEEYQEKPYLFLDVRTVSPCSGPSRDSVLNALADELTQAYMRYNNHEKFYLTIRDRGLINVLLERGSPYKILLEAPYNEAGFNYVKENNLAGMILKNPETTGENVKELQSRGFEVCLYNIKVQTGVVSAVNKGPDFIMTDNIPLTLNTLKAARK